MQKNYLDQRIEEALADAKGDRAVATQTLLAWCLQDKLLEDGLFANFREAVTHAQVQRVAHQLEQKLTGKKSPGGKASIDNTALGRMVAAWEENFDRNPKSVPTPTAPPTTGSNANHSHSGSLRAIADAFKKPFKKSHNPTS